MGSDLMQTEYDFDVLAIRRRLGRDRWSRPHVQAHTGPSGVTFLRFDGRRSIIVTSSDLPPQISDGNVWLHASISSYPDDAPVPEYAELAELRHAVWGETGWAFQVFAPAASHVNIRGNALHLWGRLDGARIHPDFGWAGTI
jgi:hypothetical protein